MLRVSVLVMLARLVACVFDAELHEKYLQMPKDQFIEYFNSQGYTWTMTKYDDEIKRRYGARCSFNNFDKHPEQSYKDDLLKDLPKNFDSREKWPNCKSIKEINNQGNCGSCWTFGTGDTASDRTCIHKGINVHLSEQDFACMKEIVCYGADPHVAFDFWKKEGLVSKECKPYDLQKLYEGKCLKECVNKSIDYAQDKHYAEKVYSVPNAPADKIKAELFHFGPIQAVFHVYADFDDYKGGIYEHTHGKYRGDHSVRIIGYGTENNTEYWLVANSWGTDWGEKGLFRIKTFQKDIEIEKGLISGIPKN